MHVCIAAHREQFPTPYIPSPSRKKSGIQAATYGTIRPFRGAYIYVALVVYTYVRVDATDRSRYKLKISTHSLIVVQQDDLGSDVEVYGVKPKPAFILERQAESSKQKYSRQEWV